MNATFPSLPLSVADRRAFALAPRNVHPLRSQSRLDLTGVSVLVVEDDEDSRDALTQMVASFGTSVLTAGDGEEAREIVSKTAPDLILCDLRMPRLNGFQFMDWLKEVPHLCRIPVIAVSALGEHADIMRTWTAGFSAHLVKPVDYAMIEVQLRRVFWAHRPN